jgi:hypothetical protein
LDAGLYCIDASKEHFCVYIEMICWWGIFCGIKTSQIHKAKCLLLDSRDVDDCKGDIHFINGIHVQIIELTTKPLFSMATLISMGKIFMLISSL